jgi:hypothetical protein
MYWDRFDICTAYFHFSMLYSPQLNADARYFQLKLVKRLDDLRYNPGISDSNLKTCSENAKMIYMQLIRKYCKPSRVAELYRMQNSK